MRTDLHRLPDRGFLLVGYRSCAFRPSVLLIRGMSRRLQAVVLFAIVGLIANLQCYAVCFSSALNAAIHVEGCHHTPDPGHNDSGCGHRHFHAPVVTAVPDSSALSGVHLAVIPSPLPAAIPALEMSRSAAVQPATRWRGSPPGKSLFLSLSALRI